MRTSQTALFVVCGTLALAGAGPAAAGQFDADHVTLYAWIQPSQFTPAASGGNDCWGYVSPSGREYAIMGLNNGTGFVEITDPANPVILTKIPHNNSTTGDVKVYGHYAYAVNEGGSNGIQVIDMSDIDNGVVTLVGAMTEQGFARAHNIALNPDSGYAYPVFSNINSGLTAVDLSDPENPTIAGMWQGGGVHDAQIVSYKSGPYAGREIAFCCNGSSGLTIVDVTNKSNMFAMATRTYPNLGYCHQGWLSADKQYFYLDDEFDEMFFEPTTRTVIFDVSDLSNPQYAGSFTSGFTTTDHNLYVHDGFIYEANYQSGLQIFDAADPLNPVHVGYFDTYPDGNGTDFGGAWSCYPFYPSGTVIVSDWQRGLFILDVRDAVGGGELGDMNCDGAVDAEDVDPFFLAVGNPQTYEIVFPDCDLNLADVNDSGTIDAEDIDPFFVCLAAGGCP